jgi:hypothetical protein
MTDRIEPERFAEAAADAIADLGALNEKSAAAVVFADANLMPSSLVDTFEAVLEDLTGVRAGTKRR